MTTHLPLFKLEDYLGRHEFSARHLLCCSDAETLSLKELLAFADDETMQAWNALRLGYTEVKGSPPLRQDIASLYKHINPENILCSAGAEEGIFILFHTLLQKGDHVVVVTPCYQSLSDIPKSIGCDVSEIPLQESAGWTLDLNEVEKALRPHTKLMIINTPHNPTGQLLDQKTLDGLIELLRKNGTYLFSDEVYFNLGPTTTPWPDQVADIYERGISLNVMSKAYGLAGLRMGWIATQEKGILQKCECFKHYTTICNAAPSELLSRIAIRAKKQIIGRNNSIIDKNLRLWAEFLKTYDTFFSWTQPKGGCTGFVRYHGKEDSDLFSKKLLSSKSVLLLPSFVYGAGNRHFRLGFGRKSFAEGVSLLEEFMKETV